MSFELKAAIWIAFLILWSIWILRSWSKSDE
jgi:hypothetical protein